MLLLFWLIYCFEFEADEDLGTQILLYFYSPALRQGQAIVRPLEEEKKKYLGRVGSSFAANKLEYCRIVRGEIPFLSFVFFSFLFFSLFSFFFPFFGVIYIFLACRPVRVKTY